MLAKIQERAGSLDQAMRTLSDAKDIRARLLKRVQIEQPDAVEEQVIRIIHIKKFTVRKNQKYPKMITNYLNLFNSVL